MDPLLARERDIEVDLESGGTTSEDERTKDHGSSSLQTKRTLNGVWRDLWSFDRIVKGESGINSCSSSSSFGGVEGENVELLTEKNSEGEENHELVALAEKNLREAKCKKTNTRKSPKPPRPPKGPLLDAADQMLVREIAELAMRKRARMKRIKTRKRMKDSKASSSSTSLYAMVFTVLFCFVILFQGRSTRRGASVMSEGSPAPSVGSSEGQISVQFYKSFPMTGNHHHDLPCLLEQHVSGSVIGKKPEKLPDEVEK
ncbi:putative glycerol-3-phosphate acyltransferase 3-like [Hibiscus syriacus]|uniref:Glycerol-3-phosphate acyltransferase 3-like n=1 Tax=Hibiscus syriacus TaxID=106335 RepID=A0A6A3AU14_HIBSY|nr:uncharacterized protein LOC120121050 [Hibiscus syriacus]KAE8708180.1 putative glycerol-3-phosphate acyltransferase 3-like [Hibiscus syriacus]